MSNSPLVNFTQISPNKGTRDHAIDTITIHCMAGNLTVETCGSLFSRSSTQASSNYGVGSDGRIGLYVEEKDRSWATSSRSNDNRAVTIEVANDGGEPDWHVSDAALNSLIKLVADICKRNNIKKLKWQNDSSLIGQVDQQNMTVHRWFDCKACPGDYLMSKHSYIANEVNKILSGQSGKWVQDSKGWKYILSDGSCYKSCWQEIDSKWYYFGSSGYMAADKYIKSADYATNKLYYYVDEKGAWNNRSYKWENPGTTKKRLKGQESNHYVRSKFANIDGKTYYFKSDGYASIDKYIKSPTYSKTKTFYYMDKTGAWNKRTYKWEGSGANKKLKGQESKHYVKSKFANVNGKWYYFNKDGKVTTGTVTINGKKYTFNSDGSLKDPKKPY